MNVLTTTKEMPEKYKKSIHLHYENSPLMAGGEELINIEIDGEPEFPFGLPNNLDFCLLFTSSINLGNEASKAARKEKTLKEMKSEGVISAYLSKIGNLKKITEKQQMTMLALSFPNFRRAPCQETIRNGLLTNSLEGFFIKRYLKEKGYNKNLKQLSRDDEFLKNSDYFAGNDERSIVITMFLDNVPYFIPHIGTCIKLLALIWRDLDDELLERNAALAYFSLASYADSKDMLDFLYLFKPDVFNKHFSNLICTTPSSTNLINIPEYKSLFADISEFNELKPERYRNKCITGISTAITKVILFLQDPEKTTPFLDYGNPENVQHLLLNTTKMLDEISIDIKESKINQIKKGLDHLISLLNNKHIELIVNNSPTTSSCNTQNDQLAPTSSFCMENFVKKLEELEKNISEDNSSVIEKLCSEVEISISTLGSLLNEEKTALNSLKTELTPLLDDPLKNSKIIGELCAKIEATKETQNDAKTSAEQGVIKSLLALDAYELNYAVIDDKQACSELDVDIDKSVDNNLIDTLKIDKLHLKKKIHFLEDKVKQMSAAIDAERKEITNIKISNAEEGMHSSCREVMQKITLNPANCSLVELLSGIQYLYPSSVVILPSAVKSAKSSLFKNTAAVWKNLNTLATSYLDSINNGICDAKSRKLFPVKVFAANESNTLTQDAIAKRTCKYQNENVYFEKHLRFGVAKNSRETLRLHFEIIDKKLVIFHCGDHL